MTVTQLAGNENVHIFWTDASTEDPLVVEKVEKGLILHQQESWIAISNEQLDYLIKLRKKSGKV